MQAYYEIEAEIPDSHQLNIQLPNTIPPGRAKIAIIYETNPVAPAPNRMAEFLQSLPENPQGMSRADIQSHIDRERQTWED
ncbi:MAG: hypothetical protein AAFY57_02320 [Cyanobacteria bacterium J06642_2]